MADPIRAAILQMAAAQYPAVAGYLNRVGYKQSKPDGTGRKLEFYAKGEPDSPIPSKPTIEAFGKPSVQDVVGDLVSHYLARGADPDLTAVYKQFVASLGNPRQQRIQQERYGWDKANAGETRLYSQWANQTGNPDFFRGYTFNQWPGRTDLYTPKQLALLNKARGFLRGGAPVNG